MNSLFLIVLILGGVIIIYGWFLFERKRIRDLCDYVECCLFYMVLASFSLGWLGWLALFITYLITGAQGG